MMFLLIILIFYVYLVKYLTILINLCIKMYRINVRQVSSDYWSLGILGYELTVGSTPFNGSNTNATYSKIMNHSTHLKFPSDILLSQAFVSIIKGLLTDESKRLGYKDIIQHPLYMGTDFNGLRDQVPPFVPKVTSVDDTSNFSDVPPIKKEPHIDDFKMRLKFSGRNLPFVGFSYTPCENHSAKEDTSTNIAVQDGSIKVLKKEIERLQRECIKQGNSLEKTYHLERKLEEKMRKLESVEHIRDRLEKDLAGSVAQCAALKRTIEFEKKDRIILEQKALDLIKSAKLKWEASERTKIDALQQRINHHEKRNFDLQSENQILKEQLDRTIAKESQQKVNIVN